MYLYAGTTTRMVNTHGQPSAGLFALGVADGVYSWRSQGIDSGEYSRALLREVRELVQAGHTDVLSSMSPWVCRQWTSSYPHHYHACHFTLVYSLARV